MTQVRSYSGICFLLTVCVVSELFTVCAVKTLYIGGFFPLTGASLRLEVSEAVLGVSHLAMSIINNRSDILPGYQLQLIWNDTKCDPGHAATTLFESLYNGPQLIMLLGAACPASTRAITQIGGIWNLLQVSYASIPTDLSNERKHQLLYSTVPSYSAQNRAKIAFLNHFQWKRIATIRENDYAFGEVMGSFQQDLVNSGLELIAAEIVQDNPKSQLTNLKKKDARIIVGMFYEDQARKVLCEAFKEGMYGEHYVWVLLDLYDNKQWWSVKDDQINCTPEQMNKAAEGYFSIESARIVASSTPTISGLTSEQFLQRYDQPSKNGTELYVPFVFDAVWLIALTLNNSIKPIQAQLNKSLENFTYKDSDMAQMFSETLQKLRYRGITGTLSFTETGERTRPACIKQLKGDSLRVVGIYFPVNGSIVFSGADVFWQGGKPPIDGKITVYKTQHISTPLFSVIVIFASCGILLGFYFLWFNVKNRNNRYIKLSSPNLNNLVILGCMLIFISVYTIAIDGTYVNTGVLSGLCVARGYFLSLGYSLAVGAMFSKIWRVYQIFRNVKPKRKVFTDRELTGVVILLILADVAVMSLWTGVDRPRILTVSLPSQVKDGQHMRTILQQESCFSKYFTTWLYILLSYKLLLLLIGCFIAWVTRKATIHSLNDSRWVGRSVYNIVICVIVGMPLSLLIDGNMNALVACLSLFLMFPSTTTLCFLFVPKITKLRGNAEELLRKRSLSTLRGASTNSANTAHSFNHEFQSVNDSRVVARLQEEVATLKSEIRAIKAKQNENNAPNLSFKIGDPNKKDRGAGASLNAVNMHTPSLSPRPRLTKRPVTCSTSEEMGFKMRRTRSRSFSGPYSQPRSLDLGLFNLGLTDPLLNLKAENKELQRKLQETRISESGKLAKVLYENAQLNKKITELNVNNASIDETEKITRLMKENAELKKQLGEVSILNSAIWSDVTPRLQRKQNEERKVSKNLRELQRLLSVDLCGRRQWSCDPPSRSRPPPIGRSHSSHDLKTHISVSSPTGKTPAISPLARNEAKRFTFNGTNKKQNFHPRQPRTKLTRTDDQSEETGKWSESTQTEVSDSGCMSPSSTRRDNIDGCESDSMQRINSAFSYEDEELEDPFIETLDDSCNLNSEDIEAQSSANENQTDGAEQDAKAQIQNSSSTQAAIESLTATMDSSRTDKAADDKRLANTNQGVSGSKTVFFACSQGETFPGQQVVTNFDAASNENANHVSHDNEKTEMTTTKAEINRALEMKKEKLAKETFAVDTYSVGIDDDVFVPGTAQSPKDLPAFKRKLHWKKEQNKSDKIEKTFFV